MIDKQEDSEDKFIPPVSTSHTTKALCQLGLLRRGKDKTPDRVDETEVVARSAEGKDDEG